MLRQASPQKIHSHTKPQTCVYATITVLHSHPKHNFLNLAFVSALSNVLSLNTSHLPLPNTYRFSQIPHATPPIPPATYVLCQVPNEYVFVYAFQMNVYVYRLLLASLRLRYWQEP